MNIKPSDFENIYKILISSKLDYNVLTNEKFIFKLKDFKERVKEQDIQNMHKNKNLTFKFLEISELEHINKYKFYKSPTYNKKQSSEYYIAELNGKMVYVRKSNHWGYFLTSNGDEYIPHNWILIGGKKNSKGEYFNISQAGYIEI